MHATCQRPTTIPSAKKQFIKYETELEGRITSKSNDTFEIQLYSHSVILHDLLINT